MKLYYVHNTEEHADLPVFYLLGLVVKSVNLSRFVIKIQHKNCKSIVIVFHSTIIQSNALSKRSIRQVRSIR